MAEQNSKNFAALQESYKAYGGSKNDYVHAHEDIKSEIGEFDFDEPTARQTRDNRILAPGATLNQKNGNRVVTENPHDLYTAFEVDLARIKQSRAFRRLAGKCQVFLAPQNDHIRTRLTHAIEVAHVAVSIAKPLKLNVTLVEAMALGHDCGHGPAGHASEEAFRNYMNFDHATWGANEVLKPLNLCVETLDGIRNHSWKLPAPNTPEGEVVSWADRIAYLCHDFDDARRANIVTTKDLPKRLFQEVGECPQEQLEYFIKAILKSSKETGFVCMQREQAELLADWRKCNYEKLYLRDEVHQQNKKIITVIEALVEHFDANRNQIPDGTEHTHMAIRYVSGMTDRYALRAAKELLNFKDSQLPVPAV